MDCGPIRYSRGPLLGPLRCVYCTSSDTTVSLLLLVRATPVTSPSSAASSATMFNASKECRLSQDGSRRRLAPPRPSASPASRAGSPLFPSACKPRAPVPEWAPGAQSLWPKREVVLSHRQIYVVPDGLQLSLNQGNFARVDLVSEAAEVRRYDGSSTKAKKQQWQ